MHCPRRISIPSHRNLEKLPSFQDVSLGKHQQLFVDKVEQCNVIFDFNDSSKDRSSKLFKLLALIELQGYMKNNELFITEPMWQVVAQMFTNNVFRPVPRRRHNHSELFDLGVDESALEVAWPHIEAVYELFLLTIESNHLTTEVAKSYIDHNFVFCLLQLFASDDPRERSFLKATLYCLYCKFSNIQSLIRQSINNVFLQFTYNSETFTGVAELLEVLSYIINDLALPLKEDYKTTLFRVLLPLHKPRNLVQYHHQLSCCIVRFLEKDPTLSQVVVVTLLHYWPKVDSGKESRFLDEIGEILKMTNASEFAQMQGILFRQLAKSIASPHQEVAKRALCFWNNESFCNLVKDNVTTILPIMFASMYESSECHWNRAVQSMIHDVMTFFINTSPQLFNSCLYDYSQHLDKPATQKATRERKWKVLYERANTRSYLAARKLNTNCDIGGLIWHGSLLRRLTVTLQALLDNDYSHPVTAKRQFPRLSQMAFDLFSVLAMSSESECLTGLLRR